MCFNFENGWLEMRNKIFGVIGIVWGGSALYRWFTSPGGGGSVAYENGRTMGTLGIGVVLLLAGLYYFFKRSD